jgi:hypothetical protein
MCMLLCYVRYHALRHVYAAMFLGVMLCDMCMLLCFVRYHALRHVYARNMFSASCLGTYVCCVISGMMRSCNHREWCLQLNW